MVDRISPERRSALMSRVKGKNTLPEMRVRKLAHALGLRYRLHVGDLPGRPDLVFPKHRKIIQVNGCFWHRHEGCRKASTPSSRVEFWQNKFRRNVDRDRENLAALEASGWTPLVVWECETSDRDALLLKLKLFFRL